jgi:hypothetical protein
MPIFFALLAAGLGWAYFTRRISAKQIAPAVAAIAGVVMTMRGEFLSGIIIAAIGLFWFQGSSIRKEDDNKYIAKMPTNADIEQARALLDTPPNANANQIRARYRHLISKVHPDRGGATDRAAELNRARDLLLASINEND